MAAKASGGGSTMMMLVLIAVMFVAMYFFTIKPQKKRMAEQQERLSKVKKGDAVIIRSGLHGVVDSVDQNKNTFVLDANGIFLTFELGAIMQIVDNNKFPKEHLNTKEDTDTAKETTEENSDDSNEETASKDND